MELTERHYYRMLVGNWAAGLAVGLGIGLAVGVYATKKRLETKYDEISTREIAEAKKFYGTLYKRDEFSTPEQVASSLGREAAEAVIKYQGNETVVESAIFGEVALDSSEIEEHDDTNPENIDFDALSEFDYKAEIANRTLDEPYVIHHDEYMEAESEHSQVTITYFEGDGVLVDEHDQPIDDINGTVGLENLKQFGHGSKDPRIVYIRNDKLDIDFEVVQSKNKYVEEVLGFVEHSDRLGSRRRATDERRGKGKDRKFRGDDE